MKPVTAKTAEGQTRTVVWEVCGVQRPLLSVAKMCAAGNIVLLSSNPHIKNLRTGQATQLRRARNTFILDRWVKCDASLAAPFSEAGLDRRSHQHQSEPIMPTTHHQHDAEVHALRKGEDGEEEEQKLELL